MANLTTTMQRSTNTEQEISSKGNGRARDLLAKAFHRWGPILKKDNDGNEGELPKKKQQ